jgi:hypothetical protein
MGLQMEYEPCFITSGATKRTNAPPTAPERSPQIICRMTKVWANSFVEELRGGSRKFLEPRDFRGVNARSLSNQDGVCLEVGTFGTFGTVRCLPAGLLNSKLEIMREEVFISKASGFCGFLTAFSMRIATKG